MRVDKAPFGYGWIDRDVAVTADGAGLGRERVLAAMAERFLATAPMTGERGNLRCVEGYGLNRMALTQHISLVQGMQRVADLQRQAKGEGEFNWDSEFWYHNAKNRLARDQAGRAARHLSDLEAKIDLLEEEPASLLIPIGSVVRVVGFTDPERTVLDAGPGTSPAHGTEGVFLGRYRTFGRVEIVVVEPHMTWDRKPIDASPSEPRAWVVERENLEVIEPACYLDGTACTAYDFIATHTASDVSEMVFEAKGVFWRAGGGVGGVLPPSCAHATRAGLMGLKDIETGEPVALEPAE